MKRKDELNEAMWKIGIAENVNNQEDFENIEILIEAIEKYEKIIDRAIEYLSKQGLNIYDIEKILGV